MYCSCVNQAAARTAFSIVALAASSAWSRRYTSSLRREPAITPATAARIIDEFLRTPGPNAQASGLTDRELEVLKLVTAGLRNREIGTELGITENTVKFHLKNIVGKLHAQNRADVAARAVREGLVPDEPRDFVSYERPKRDSPPRHR